MRSKLAGPDENANRFASTNVGAKAVLGGQAPATTQRKALNDLSNNAKKVVTGKATVGKAANGVVPQRVPLQQKGARQTVPASNSAPVIAQRPAPTRTASFNENARPAIAPLPKRGPLRRTQTEVIAAPAPIQTDCEMEVEEAITIDAEIEEAPVERVLTPIADDAYDEEDTMDADEYDPEDWLYLSPERLARSEAQVNAVRDTFKDEVDEWDTTMVSEYADEIFAYMESMEVCRCLCCSNSDLNESTGSMHAQPGLHLWANRD